MLFEICRSLPVATLLALLALPAWIGAAAAQTVVRIAADPRLDVVHAPIAVAIDKGYFAAEGVDLAFEPNPNGRDAVTRLATDAADVAVADVNALIRAKAETADLGVRAVLMLHDRPGYAILGRRSRGMTKELASLAGKRLGAPTTDPAVAAWPVLRTLNRIDPAAVTLENVGVAVRTPMMVSGELDGAIGLAHAIGPDLRARGVAAEDTIQLLMSDYGVELYGNALLAGPKFLAEKPLAMAGFVKAYIRGLRDVIADPAAAIESLARRNDAIRKDVDIERLQLILDQYMLTPWVKANGFGGIDPDRFSRAIDQVAAGHQLKNRPSREDVFRDDFIPPDGRQF